MDLFNFLAGIWEWDIPRLENVEELKDKGNYKEETVEKDGRTIKRISFESFDGSTKFFREETVRKGFEKYLKVNDLRNQLNHLIHEQKFEDAAKIRDELKTLKAELKAEKETKKLASSKA
jgi:excinuclease UvrABC helicase subunit UvrB